MKYRIPLAAAVVTAVLLATGFAWANGSDDSSPSSSTTSPTSTSSTATSSTSPTVNIATASTNAVVAPTAPSTAAQENSTASIPDGTSRIFVIADAGAVLLGRSGASLQIIAATPNAGWASEVEDASGREVEGDFRNGKLRVKYNFELEDGTVRVRIETRIDNADGDDDDGTIDDDQRGDDDDDNSGPGSGDEDDNSGSGHDDDDGDHDNSGPGGGGSDDND